MSNMLTITAVCLLTTPVFAEKLQTASKVSDDYVACLIGRSGVALQAQQSGHRDAAKAQAIAYKQCKPKGKIEDNEGEGLSDFVNMMVEKMAN